jgi:Tfp pilus tip-associated adhesin PilY1
MPVEFNPQGAHKAFIKGDIGIHLRWVNGEPAIVLFPLFRRTGSGAFVVCLSAAHQYTDDDYLIAQSHKAADVMGMGRDKFVIHRIADAINDALVDLCAMPPEPVIEKKTPDIGVSINGNSVSLECAE